MKKSLSLKTPRMQVRKIKGIVIYDSSHGNTKTIAETIANSLKNSAIEVDLFYIKNVKRLDAKLYDFLILGSPTKFGTMTFATKFFLGRLKKDEWVNKPFAAFDTENPENEQQAKAQNKEWSAAEKIAQNLKEKKMKQLLPVLKALGIGQKGPLVDGEIDRARLYAIEIGVKLNQTPINSL